MHYGYGGGWMWIIFVIIIALLVYFLVQASKKESEQISTETPLDILKKRYAKGEITKEEFEQMKEDIKKE